MSYLHNNDFSKAHPAWQKATDLVGVLETSLFAFENDSVNVPLHQRGIDVSLSVAIQMGLELREMCEKLEDGKDE